VRSKRTRRRVQPRCRRTPRPDRFAKPDSGPYSITPPRSDRVPTDSAAATPLQHLDCLWNPRIGYPRLAVRRLRRTGRVGREDGAPPCHSCRGSAHCGDAVSAWCRRLLDANGRDAAWLVTYISKRCHGLDWIPRAGGSTPRASLCGSADLARGLPRCGGNPSILGNRPRAAQSRVGRGRPSGHTTGEKCGQLSGLSAVHADRGGSGLHEGQRRRRVGHPPRRRADRSCLPISGIPDLWAPMVSEAAGTAGGYFSSDGWPPPKSFPTTFLPPSIPPPVVAAAADQPKPCS
jgi:hypothetical protein